MRAAPTSLRAVQTIQFHEDTVTTVKIGEEVRVAIRPICEKLGLDWSHQLNRTIRRDPVLKEGVAVLAIPSPGGAQEMVTLPLEFLNGWLFKVNAGRYKPDDPRREVIIRYQRECFQALYAYWHQGAAVNPRIRDALPAAEGAEEARTSLRLREELRELSDRLARIESRVEGAEALPPALPGGLPETPGPDPVSPWGAPLILPRAGLDSEGLKLRELLLAWAETFGPEGASVGRAVTEAKMNRKGRLWAAVSKVAGDGRGGISNRYLGQWIAKNTERKVGGWGFVRVGTWNANAVWAVDVGAGLRAEGSTLLPGPTHVATIPERGAFLTPLPQIWTSGPPVNLHALRTIEPVPRGDAADLVDKFLQERVIDGGNVGRKVKAADLRREFLLWSGLSSFPTSHFGAALKTTSLLTVYKWRGAGGGRYCYMFVKPSSRREVAR